MLLTPLQVQNKNVLHTMMQHGHLYAGKTNVYAQQSCVFQPYVCAPGGMPPDEVVEYDDDLILQDMQRCIETYHDDSKYSMLRMGLAPCAPFNVTNNLMIKSAALARSYNKVSCTLCDMCCAHCSRAVWCCAGARMSHSACMRHSVEIITMRLCHRSVCTPTWLKTKKTLTTARRDLDADLESTSSRSLSCCTSTASRFVCLCVLISHVEQLSCTRSDKPCPRRVGWDKDDVWFAHCCMLDKSERELFADRGIGIAHCPSSNLRLASGAAQHVDAGHAAQIMTTTRQALLPFARCWTMGSTWAWAWMAVPVTTVAI